MSATEHEPSLLDKLDTVVPAPLAQFDAFPKLPSTYKSRSESRGFLTIFVVLLCILLTLNDIGEYIFGWPDHEFSVDSERISSFMTINVDMVVNMPCKHLSVDLKDTAGDRLYLSNGLRRDGTFFDIGQATALKEHSAALSATQVVAQSRRSRGIFSTLGRWTSNVFRPKYKHVPHAHACRISGSLEVKKVGANLHITTGGHGYMGMAHTDHSLMNLSHVITEFSFGAYFPDITQPLDYSLEVAQDAFIAYHYFLHVVPTTYIAPRTSPLRTNQYSVTHYTHTFEHGKGTPGIFFKFDLDPLSLTIHQRTITFVQLMIRCVGVVGGVFVCAGYAIRVTARAVEVVSGAEKDMGIVAAEASGAKVGLRHKWGGASLRARTSNGRMVRQGGGWVLEGSPGISPSPYASYTSTPMSDRYSPSPAGIPQLSPYLNSPSATPGLPPPASPRQATVGLGIFQPTFGPAPQSELQSSGIPRSPNLGTSIPRGSSPYAPVSPAPPIPGTPTYNHLPVTPDPTRGTFPYTPPPRSPSRSAYTSFKDEELSTTR